MAYRNHDVVQKYLFVVVENFVALSMPNHRMKLDVTRFIKRLCCHGGALFFHLYLEHFHRIFFHSFTKGYKLTLIVKVSLSLSRLPWLKESIEVGEDRKVGGIVEKKKKRL